ERNKHRGLPCCRNFGDRARTRPANHQIGTREGRRHVFDELENFRGFAQTAVSRQRVIIVTLTSLVQNVNARSFALQNGQASNHRFVDGVCTLASTEHQQSWSASALGW